MRRSKVDKDAVFLHFTGNMFGIGCSAFSLPAIDRINALKQRANGKGLIVLLAEKSWLQKFGIRLSPQMDRLLQQYWPGDLTVILPDPQNNFAHVSVDGAVAFRLPTDPFLRDFIKKFQEPIVSTSVNLSGEPPLTDLAELRQKYGSWFDLEILPSKLHERNLLLSTIIREENGKLFCCGKAGSNLRNSNMPGKSRQSGSFALPIFVAARWQNIIYAGKLQS